MPVPLDMDDRSMPAAASPERSHAALIGGLRRQIFDVLAPLAPAQKFAFVDFPAHANVGDSAIWLGGLRFMREVFGANPAYVAKPYDFDAAACRGAIGDGPIFITGGGNFGDLWTIHQVFLRELLGTFPERPIIQLPQSIHFRDAANFAMTAAAIARHGNFTLFVRDRASLAAAERFDCPTHLCCDLAMWLGPQSRPTRPRTDVLCLLRDDRERAQTRERPDPVEGRRLVTDWLDESLPAVRLRRLLAIGGAVLLGRLHRHVLRRISFEAAARARVRRGLRLLASGHAMVTDRLHAHILAVLLGLPHAILDNSYGKLTAFVNCWTRRCPDFSVHQALAPALRWAEQPRSPAAPARPRTSPGRAAVTPG